MVVRRLLKALGGYSDNFMAALYLWPIAYIVLTLPILAYLYHRDGRLKFGSIVSTYLAVLYLVGLGCFTLYPLPSGSSGLGITYGIPWQLNPLAPMSDIARLGLAAIPQIIFNVIFFVPLGFIAGRMLRLRLVPSLLLGFAVSLLIEVAQGSGLFGIYPFAYRTADVDDLIYNTSGALLGWLGARLLNKILPSGALAEEGEITHTPGFVRRSVAFWLDMLLVGLISIVAEGLLQLGVWALTNLLDSGAFADPSSVSEISQWITAIAQTPSSWIGVAAFVLVEVIMPWFHEGSTPGGGFVRMSFETHERTAGKRFIFYVVRVVVLMLSWLYIPIAWPILIIFWLFSHKMPYDLI